MSSQEDSPVKTSQVQVSSLDLKENDLPCSTKSCELLGRFDLASSCLKTLEIWYLTSTGRRSRKSSSKLPKQGTMRNGQLFRLLIWEPAISEKGSGSLLGTPRANLHKNSRIDSPSILRRAADPNHNYQNLEIQFAKMLPTPCVMDSTHNHMHGSVLKHRDLAGQLAQDPSVQIGEGMYLNPSFVEEMMGFPVGWSDLDS